MAKLITDPINRKKSQCWEQCFYCPLLSFKTSADFIKHLRDRHCSREGGSYVCRFGFNGVCASLPLDGVSDRDYESHVIRCHVSQTLQEPEWSVFSAAQNLPAVLNDPMRGKQTNLFTKKWGDSFAEKTHIPKSEYLENIVYEDFEIYLKQFGKRFHRHQRFNTKMSISSETADDPRSPPRRNSVSNDTLNHKKVNIRPALTININNSSESSQYHHGDGSLKDIPEIFFKSFLDISQPAYFGAVFPGMSGEKDQTVSSRLLQEKLSHYLDIVEVQIAKQVSSKSSAFFHAMTSQDTIMDQMNEAVQHIKKFRMKIQAINTLVVKDSLKIMHLARTRQNYNNVLEKLKLMATVHQTQPMIQLLLGTQDYVAALDLIGTTQEIVAQELTGVHSFRHLPMQLKEMERLIDKMLSAEFERYSTADLNRPLLEDGENDRVLDEDKLICIIMGLLREGNFSFIEMYKDEAIVAIKAITKQMVIEVIASSDEEVCLTGAGENVQNFPAKDWIYLLQNTTASLLKLLKRVKQVYVVMTQTADASAGRISDSLNFIDSEAFLAEQNHKIVMENIHGMIKSICDYCHERCSNLLASQNLDKISISCEDFEKLVKIIEHFCNSSSDVMGFQVGTLIAALKLQGAKFSQKFHTERKCKLALLLDSERWKQVDIPNEFQKIIECVSRNHFNFTKFDNFNGDNHRSNTLSSPVLLVEGTAFTLVGTVLILIQIITEYCRCASHLPIIAGLLSRHVVDLLRTFNSRSCQLVLGAGALHVAGLKTITSANLALVSRAIQLILWALPKIKQHFRELDSSSTNSGYDTIEKDFLSHIKEIENKIISLITSLVINQLQNWDARPPVPSQSFRLISRHLLKLHEAVAPILEENQIYLIYKTVHKSFKDKLREQIVKNNIVYNGGPAHGVVISELTFYMETLRTLNALPESEMSDNTMEEIWTK